MTAEAFDRLPRSRCRCGAEMAWAETQKGSRIPLSTRLGHPRANLVLEGSQVRVVPLGTGAYFTHFAECPLGTRYRKRP